MDWLVTISICLICPRRPKVIFILHSAYIYIIIHCIRFLAWTILISFASKVDILKNIQVHDNPENGFQCKDCSRKFYSRQGFLKHVSTKSCTVPLRCLVCGKTYSNKARDSFKMHMKHHRAEADGVQFQCEECGRVYLTEEALRKHRLKHTGVRPYKCETCGKAFPMRYMVRDHMRTHTGKHFYSFCCHWNLTLWCSFSIQ